MSDPDTPPFFWPHTRIEEFCRRWKVAELSLFGSALREDFRPESDIDLLVRFGRGRPRPSRFEEIMADPENRGTVALLVDASGGQTRKSA